MPTRGKKDPNGRALRGRRAHTTFISDPIAQIWSNYNVRSGAAGAATPEQPAVQNCLYDRFEALYKKSSIKPSLVIVPARFKSGTLYSEIPTSGAGDFTVTRATSATRVNASGLIEVQKTNLFLQSAGFEVSGNWSPTSTTVTTGSTTAFTAPDNSTDADLITATGSGSSFIGQNTTIASGTYTISVFAKAGNYGLFRIGNVLSAARAAWFNLNAGVVTGTVNGGTASMQNYGNGWYRCIYTSSGMVSGNTFFAPSDAPNSTNAVSGSSIYFWGAQLEEGLSASEYIPTTTIARTRFAGVTVDGTVATNIPRLDYFASGGTVGCPALLVEPSAQNQCQRSEEFNNAFHFPFNLNAFGSGSVANTTATLDPYGTNVADYIQENSAAGVVHGIIDVFAGNVSGTTFTWSVFAKAAERTIINLFNNGGGGGSANFNLITGVATLVAGVSASMQNYGNGWWRCVLTYTSSATGNHNVQIRLCDASGNSTYNGTGNQGAYIFGAQLETGSVATSYIPTTTAAVTRNADVISVSGAVSGSIGQASGTIYAEVDIRNMAKETYLIRIDDGATANVITFRTLTSNLIRTAITAPTTSGTINISSAPFTAGIIKIAFAYKSGEIALSVNGATALTANGTFVFGASLNRITLGSNVSGGELNDRIRAAALYTTRLTNAQLAFITQP